jgi:apolipoprotein N-acyltransferase
MYRGPFAKTGANLRLGDGGILELPDGRKAAALICYEAFLTWPAVSGMWRKPDVLLVAANLWWCRDTSLPASMERAAALWGKLFGVPVAFARNI